MTTEDGEGVMLVPEPMVEAEGAQQQVLAAREMKHTPPDICEMKKGRMSCEMVRMLRELMDPDRMSDEVAKFWLKYGIDEAAGDDEMTAGDGAVEVADDIATPVEFDEAEC